MTHLDNAAWGMTPWTGPGRGVREATRGGCGMPAIANSASPGSSGDCRWFKHQVRPKGALLRSRSMVSARCLSRYRSRSASRATKSDDHPLFRDASPIPAGIRRHNLPGSRLTGISALDSGGRSAGRCLPDTPRAGRSLCTGLLPTSCLKSKPLKPPGPVGIGEKPQESTTGGGLRSPL